MGGRVKAPKVLLDLDGLEVNRINGSLNAIAAVLPRALSRRTGPVVKLHLQSGISEELAT